jgi:hypothetical protein
MYPADPTLIVAALATLTASVLRKVTKRIVDWDEESKRKGSRGDAYTY